MVSLQVSPKSSQNAAASVYSNKTERSSWITALTTCMSNNWFLNTIACSESNLWLRTTNLTDLLVLWTLQTFRAFWFWFVHCSQLYNKTQRKSFWFADIREKFLEDQIFASTLQSRLKPTQIAFSLFLFHEISGCFFLCYSCTHLFLSI